MTGSAMTHRFASGSPFELFATLTTPPFAHETYPETCRLWHLRRLEASESFNETWLADHSCYGHNPDDFQPFHNLFIQDTPEPDGVRHDNKVLSEAGCLD